MKLPSYKLPTLFFIRNISIHVSFVVVFLLFSSTKVQAQQADGASLTFSPDTISTQIGTEFTTELILDTAGEKVGGVGAKIVYDPTLVHIEKIETIPVFPDFPSQTFDNAIGKATISGIVQNPDQLYSGKAVFAKITWKAQKAGTGKISFDFVPNSTKDSNIAVLYGNGDILQKVNQVNLTVSADTRGTAQHSQKDTATTPSFSIQAERGTLFNIFIVVILIASQISLWHKNQQIEKKVDQIAKVEIAKKTEEE